jgi:hypothetical protein
MEESQFNAQAYLDANPDVAASGLDPWMHYQSFGINEGRALSAPVANPTQFNAQAYLAANPDVAAAGMDPLQHYTMYGQNEGRQASFDYDAEAAKYAEQLANANAQTELNKYQFSNTGNESAADIYGLKTSNPNLFYSKMADSLSNQMFTNYTGNRSGYNAQLTPILESIKAENPTAYYNAQLGLLGKEQGWQHGQNTFGNAAGYQAEVNRIAPEALAAGLTADQINSLVGGGFSEASTANQQRIANLPSAGSYWRDNLIGTGKVAAMALGAYGLDAAMAAAEAGAATGMVDASGNIIGGGAEGAAYGAGAMGPTYAELGYVPGAFTDANLGYTGAAEELGLAGSSSGLTDLSGAQGSAMLESLGLNTSGMSASDILKYASQAKQVLGTGSSLAKLLGGSGTGTGSQQLANSLRSLATPIQTNDFLGQYKMNQNPFTFSSQGQTTASPGMYDVSGSNMANALRKS